jgi:hypothetical protein
MAYTTINKSTDYFNTKLWTGNGSTQNITGVNHTPDFVWIKKRTDADGARIFDTVRGATKGIFTNSTAAETTVTSELSAFGSDGYTLGASDAVNGNSKNYVGWNWKANGQGSSNTDGSINTTYTSVNTTAGFSICKWTGTGSAGTIGHGLGAVPKMIIIKDLSNTRDWFVYHASVGNNKRLKLNDTVAEGASTVFNSTTPTSSVFSIDGSVYVNNSGSNYIAYCFAEKAGYSKFGSYTGNGNADGPFIYTGFKPSFLMVKRTDTADTWIMYDNKRIGYNPNNYFLQANSNAAESSSDRFDLLSNGFKPRYDWTPINASGGTYIYMAFGQSIVGSNNIPATAR